MTPAISNKSRKKSTGTVFDRFDFPVLGKLQRSGVIELHERMRHIFDKIQGPVIIPPSKFSVESGGKIAKISTDIFLGSSVISDQERINVHKFMTRFMTRFFELFLLTKKGWYNTHMTWIFFVQGRI